MVTLVVEFLVIPGAVSVAIRDLESAVGPVIAAPGSAGILVIPDIRGAESVGIPDIVDLE